MKYLLVVGNPIDGLKFHGPFTTRHDAIKWAEDYIKDEWRIAQFEDFIDML